MSSPTLSPADGPRTDLAYGWRVVAVISLCAAQTAMTLAAIFVVFADLESAFPSASEAQLSWAINTYTIVGAAMIVIASALGERYGRKRMVMGGTGLFALASIASGLAPSIMVLIIARGCQAIGAALILPSGNALILDAFPLNRRASGIAVMSAMGGISAAVGPALGGVIIDAASWRWVFFVSVPTAALALVLAQRILVEHAPNRDRELPDLLSALLVVAGVGLLVLSLVQAGDWGWTSGGTIGAFLVGLALIAVLAFRSDRVAHPIVDLALFRYSSFRVGGFLLIAFTMSFFAMQFASVVFLTDVWGYEIRDAGLLTAPVFLVTGLTAIASGPLADRFGTRQIVFPGTVMWLITMAVLWSILGDERSATTWIIGVVIAGIGSGLFWGPIMTLVVEDVPPERFSLGSGVGQTLMLTANALTTALAISLITGSDATRAFADFNSLIALVLITAAIAVAVAGTAALRS